MIRYFVGAGGKTSTIYNMAKAFKNKGKKVLITTTTHMFVDEKYMAKNDNIDSYIEKLNEGILLYAKKVNPKKIGLGIETKLEGEKLFLKKDEKIIQNLCEIDDNIKILIDEADEILVEADGSARKPIKFPNKTEPVILNDCEELNIVMGLSSIGKQKEKYCHRYELVNDVTNEENISNKFISKIIIEGYLKRFSEYNIKVILNQADNDADVENAKVIIEDLKGNDIKKELKYKIQTLKRKKMSIILMASGFGRRFGSNKLLHEVNGKPIFKYSIEMLEELKRIIYKKYDDFIELEIIVVSQYDAIRKLANEHKYIELDNDKSIEGISASIRIGTKKATGDYYMYLVADQINLKAETVAKYIKQYIVSEKPFALLKANDRLGGPKIFHNKSRNELLKLKGENGGSKILDKKNAFYFDVEEIELKDIDSNEDIKKFSI